MLAAVVVGVVTWALFGGWGQNAPTVAFRSLGFTVNGDSVDIKYQVSAPDQSEVACVLASMSESKAVVGWRVVTHTVTGNEPNAFEEPIVVIRPANSGYVHDCWVLAEGTAAGASN